MRMLVYLMYVLYLNLFSVILTRCILITYQSLMLHWRNNNYSYLTKYVISDLAHSYRHVYSLSFLLLLLLLFIHVRENRESPSSLLLYEVIF